MRDVGVGSNPAARPPWALPAVASLPRPLCPSDISLASGATPGPPPSSLLKEGRRRKSELLMSTVFHSLRLDSIVAYVAVKQVRSLVCVLKVALDEFRCRRSFESAWI